MTDIYLAISLSTHNGDDTPQNYALTKTTKTPAYEIIWTAA